MSDFTPIGWIEIDRGTNFPVLLPVIAKGNNGIGVYGLNQRSLTWLNPAREGIDFTWIGRGPKGLEA